VGGIVLHILGVLFVLVLAFLLIPLIVAAFYAAWKMWTDFIFGGDK